MEYHKKPDILHIMKLLGHKNINNTLIYTQRIDVHDAHAIGDEDIFLKILSLFFEFTNDRNQSIMKVIKMITI